MYTDHQLYRQLVVTYATENPFARWSFIFSVPLRTILPKSEKINLMKNFAPHQTIIFDLVGPHHWEETIEEI